MSPLRPLPPSFQHFTKPTHNQNIVQINMHKIKIFFVSENIISAHSAQLLTHGRQKLAFGEF